MFDPADLRPDDRVLLLGIPDPRVIAEAAARLSQGVLVALGEEERVREARRAARDLHNVMFVPGTPDEIPWDDGFFTRVVDLVGHWPSPDRVRLEIERVTAPRGAR
jgi:hypothetical protein